jgi:hypothetical protein
MLSLSYLFYIGFIFFPALHIKIIIDRIRPKILSKWGAPQITERVLRSTSFLAIIFCVEEIN